MGPSEIVNVVNTLPDVDQGMSIETGFGASLTSDISQFESSLEQVSQVDTSSEIMEVAKAALEPFDNLNVRAAELAEFAENATADGSSFTPGEIVTLTYKAQEFGFHSQLTANVANRLADGIQQLFRQQG